MKKNDKSLAFTLAETLLTLVIAGVVMAVMMRAINRISPDKEKLMFIKTYHALETAMANTVNDPTKYDPTYYSDNEVDNMTQDEKNGLHRDFRDLPIPPSKVEFIDSQGKTKTACVPYKDNEGKDVKCDEEITKENAICYFMSEQLNTNGEVNCKNNDGITFNGGKQTGINMRLSNGSCIAYLQGGTNSDGFYSFSISPQCNNDTKTGLYAVFISADGKLTVPKTNDNIGANQEKAYSWMEDQTNIRK